jgi:hypothetical protein
MVSLLVQRLPGSALFYRDPEAEKQFRPRRQNGEMTGLKLPAV